MPLHYWRRDNYQKDLDLGAGYHFNEDNPRMHDVERGDPLEAYTCLDGGRNVPVTELVLQAKTTNWPGFRYEKYRVWGDVDRSRYFRGAAQH